MKTLTIFLIMINFLTGSLDTIRDGLMNALSSSQTYSFKTLTIQLIKPEPVRNLFYADPQIEASSAIIIDTETNKVLFEKNPDEHLAMASITKIMTALIVLKYTPDLQKIVRISKRASKISGSQIYLWAGETITVENLLKGMLIESANDAAYALAESTLGTTTRFVDAMNRYTLELNLTNTHFTNTYGGDNENHYSTARDLAKLASHALQNETFKLIVNIKQTTITDTTGKFKHQLKNTNKLVSRYLNVIGVKTGTTLEAGASLVAAVEGESGQTVIVVLLNSPQRFTEGKILLDWALKAYAWIEPL